MRVVVVTMVVSPGPKVINEVMLLDEVYEIFGNESMLLQKVGRLLLVADTLNGGGVTTYVLNTADYPMTHYQAKQLREECLTGRRTFKEAFCVHDRALLREPDVTFQKAMDGTFCIRFKQEPLRIDASGGEVFNALAKELRDDLRNVRDGDGPTDRGYCEREDEDADSPVWWERTNLFIDLIQVRAPRVKVLLHLKSPTAALKASENGFDVVVNIAKAACVIPGLPNFWEVYYDSSIEFHPVILKLPKESLKPITMH